MLVDQALLRNGTVSRGGILWKICRLGTKKFAKSRGLREVNLEIDPNSIWHMFSDGGDKILKKISGEVRNLEILKKKIFILSKVRGKI